MYDTVLRLISILVLLYLTSCSNEKLIQDEAKLQELPDSLSQLDIQIFEKLNQNFKVTTVKEKQQKLWKNYWNKRQQYQLDKKQYCNYEIIK